MCLSAKPTGQLEYWDYGLRDHSVACGLSGSDCLQTANKPVCENGIIYETAHEAYVYNIHSTDYAILTYDFYCGASFN